MLLAYSPCSWCINGKQAGFTRWNRPGDLIARSLRWCRGHSARSIARRVEFNDVCSTAEFIFTRPSINLAISETGHRNSCTFGLAHKSTFISTASDCFQDVINHIGLYYSAPIYISPCLYFVIVSLFFVPHKCNRAAVFFCKSCT